jgi:hypothetical protein
MRGKGVKTYTTSTTNTATTATSATTAAATATRALATLVTAGTLAATGSTFLSLSGLGRASELHRDLAREDLLAGESLDGSGRLGSSGEVNECVSNGAVGAGVHWDRGALAGGYESATVAVRWKGSREPSSAWPRELH